MAEKKTAIDWVFYGAWSVLGQVYLWGVAWLAVWFSWDVTLVRWLNATNFVGKESELVYIVVKIIVVVHILITIALLLLELLLSRR